MDTEPENTIEYIVTFFRTPYEDKDEEEDCKNKERELVLESLSNEIDTDKCKITFAWDHNHKNFTKAIEITGPIQGQIINVPE